MSASRNADAMNSAQGEFHSRRPRDEPLTTKGVGPYPGPGHDSHPQSGHHFRFHSYDSLKKHVADADSPPQHAPGVMVGNDAVPEFSAETYPPGTAEKVAPNRTFTSNTTEEVPGQADNASMQNPTNASDTLRGATSADVHQGLGRPMEGMTSQEEHGGHRKKERSGLEGVGVSETDPISQRGQDMDHEKYGDAGKPGRPEDWKLAEDRPGVGAEGVAKER